MDKNHEENLKKGRLLIERLEEIQYSHFNGRPLWTTIQKNDLKLFLACIYYKNPSPSNAIENNNYEDDNNSEKIFKLYEEKIQTQISNVYKTIEEKYIEPDHHSDIDVGVTIIHSICKKKCDTCQNFPAKDIHKHVLIRLKLINNECIFFDIPNNRRYTSWDQYLKKNDLPEGFMFYPKSGFYDASKNLYQSITPASTHTEKIIETADIASHISNWVGGIALACGLIFPLAAPIIMMSGALVTASSSYLVVRNIDRIIDMYKYQNHTTGTEVWIHFMNLAIAAIGTIATPFHTLAIASEASTTVRSSSKALTIFRTTASITQCTLEVFRATLEFIDNDFKLTYENVLKLRLDLFMIMGTLMPSSIVKDILKLLAVKSVWVPIYKTLEQIPYCLGQTVWNSVYFFKSHFTVFVERVTMFLAENLTPQNLLFSWKTIRRVFEGYQKQIAQLDVGDLLRHVVDGIAVDESVKYVLRGQRMVKLLDSLSGKKPIGRALIKYFVDRVLQKAMKLQADRDECVADLAKRGETSTWEVDVEFCKCYGIERCAMDQYALWAIGEVGVNATDVMAEYEEYASRPENMFDDEMVVNEGDGSGWSAKGYTFVAPCGVLDLEFCLRLSEKINPQPHHYLDHKHVQPEPGVSLLFGVSAYSVNIVFFGIDLINGVPKMNICFFQQDRDSDSSISNHSGFKKLQAA
ncbi:uncharacterized protein LOC111028070 [Myzus persicae]|uniref:uncharacterized protein LOC111028070 n=1 Tax=Myzus persicae TaxID=13164 RepID=UPI000B930A04|nr:uncharacterized protein LOC111028070 [Myzus persicae]XP_022162292.1 uncharacterized protein LOC111028070 [Myzus persicae]XP_022162293.1 uncharacterized protein LOC111028070 [Myzus persicae]XP_022162294.1 uncharacterized protein LOC111028070 [Myzus persicae]